MNLNKKSYIDNIKLYAGQIISLYSFLTYNELLKLFDCEEIFDFDNSVLNKDSLVLKIIFPENRIQQKKYLEDLIFFNLKNKW